MRALLAIALLLFSCNDRTRDVPPISFEPRPVPDAGTMMVEAGPPNDPDGICNGQLDGASCELPQALGICSKERCVLLACEEGFGDCSAAASGCETSVADADNCGDCDVACAEEQQCQRGPQGFVCAAGLVCPVDSWDLDSDGANGCEWSGEWEQPYQLAPPDLEIEAVGWFDAPVVAGGVGDSRISVALGATPQTTVWLEPRGEARAVDVQLSATHERVVWTDGVSVRRIADQAMFFVTPDCVTATVPRRFVAATADYVATQHEIWRVDTACVEGACLELVFAVADYQAAAFASFGALEVASCDGCALALDAECWGLEQCRDPMYDAIVCAGCNASSCPTLEIVDLIEVGNSLGVVTSRGALMVDVGGGLLDRVESAFDPLVGGGPRFVAGLEAPGALTLFHSTAYVRLLDTDLAPLGPDLGVSFDPESAALAGFQDVFVAVDSEAVRLTRPGSVSGRTVFLDLTTAPGIQGLRAVAPATTPDGVRVFYTAAGQLYPRLLAPQ